MRPAQGAFPRAGLALGLAFTALSVLFASEPYRPAIDPANFVHGVTNPYFPLVPGATATFLEQDGRERRENKVAVTHEVKTVMGIRCIVVHDTVTLDGVLKEETYDWFAQDRQGTVWYFGETTRKFLPGGRVSTAGSWEAGVNGGLPGVMMPAHPRVGLRYRQEYAASEAEDIAQITALDDTVTVPFGTFQGCVRTREWSMLDSGTSKKWFAKGVGLVREETTSGEVSTLVSVTRK